MEPQTAKESQNVSKQKKKRTCSNCKSTGHDKRNCSLLKAAVGTNPVLNLAAHQNRVAGQQHPSPTNQTTTQDYSILNLDRCLYVVLDLETTGMSRQADEIMEISAQILDGNGIQVEDGIFFEFCRPSRPMPRFISELTGITDKIAQFCISAITLLPYYPVAQSFINFITSQATEQTVDVNHIVFFAHNGNSFLAQFAKKA